MKKLICLILAMVLALGLLACGNTAQTGGTTTTPATPSTPSNPTTGGQPNEPAKPVGPEKWTKADELPTSGDYILDTDVTIDDTIYVDGSLILDLNGHTITRTVAADVLEDHQAIRAPEGTTLHIKDSSAEGTGVITATYPADVKCKSPAALIHADENTTVTIDGGTYDASAIQSIYTDANGGAIATGGKLIINNATIKGYKNVATGSNNARGTVIGGWSTSDITINNGVFVGGGSKGDAATIACGGNLTVNGGDFSVNPELTGNVARHAALILTTNNKNKPNTLTINGGNFVGAQVEHNGGCINSACRTIINGGTFKAAKGYQGGVIMANQSVLTVTGGTFIGAGYNGSDRLNVGGIIMSNGPKLEILGGTFSGSGDAKHGYNIFFDYVGGLVTIGGEANLDGGVCMRSQDKNVCAALNLTGKAVIDATKATNPTKYSIKIRNTDIRINGEPTGISAGDDTNYEIYDVTYDNDGNVSGVTKAS